MNRTDRDTVDLSGCGAGESRDANPLNADLERIVRRALRRPFDRSPMARAVRAAAAQVEFEPDSNSSMAEDVRVRQIARRLSALLTPGFRDAPGRGAHRETVCA